MSRCNGVINMRLIVDMEFVDMGTEIIAVPVGDNAERVRGVLRLNEQAKEILELLENETTVESILDKLCSKYENDRFELKRYIVNLVSILKTNGILDM